MSEPLLRQILGAGGYASLAPVIQRHFDLSPSGRSTLTVRGTMTEIWHSRLAKLYLPVGMALGALIPWRGRNVPATVHYRADDRGLWWRREFVFPRRTHVFSSRMESDGAGVGAEFVRLGVGTRLRAAAVDGRLQFRSAGYVWQAAGRRISLPLAPVLGNVTVEEWALGPEQFGMQAEIRHPRLGLLFRYAGEFDLPEDERAITPAPGA